MIGWRKLSVLLKANVPGWPKTRPGLQGLAERRGWERRDGKGRGRKNFEYLLKDLHIAELQALFDFEKQNSPAAVGTKMKCAGETPAGAEAGATPVPVTAGAIVTAAAAGAAVASGTLDEREARRRYAWQQFELKPKARKAEAIRRAAAVARADELIKLSWPPMEVYRSVAAEFSVGISTLRQWISEVAAFDASDYAAALIDKRAGRSRESSYPSRVDDLFRADYLRKDRPTAASCYDRTRAVAEREGLSVPPLITIRRPPGA